MLDRLIFRIVSDSFEVWFELVLFVYQQCLLTGPYVYVRAFFLTGINPQDSLECYLLRNDSSNKFLRGWKQ